MRQPQWNHRFDALAAYNGDPDKSKYTQEYRDQMAQEQAEYDLTLLAWARRNNVIVLVANHA